MNKKEFIQRLSEKLDDKKPQFLAEVRAEVAQYIEGQGKGCLTIIEDAPSGPLTWKLDASLSYLGRLKNFCRNKPYDGHALDSGLTKPVVQIVTRRFEKLYEQSSNEIAEGMLKVILEDKVMSETLANSILASTSLPIAAIRNRAASLVLEQLRTFLQTSTGHTVTNFVGKTVAATVSKPVGMQLAALLVKSLSLQLKTVIAKILASAALKGAIATAVKKFILFAVAGAIVKAIAVKFGVSLSAALTWVLIPVVMGYLAYEIIAFPGHLAEKVSAKIADELSGNYAAINAEVLDKVIAQVIETGIAVIVRPIADSPEVQDAIAKIIRELD